MKDDFQLFGGSMQDGSPIDPDIALLTAYLARELSPVQKAAVERRLASDAAFAATARPLIAAWRAPLGRYAAPVGVHHVRGEQASLATQEELDRGWRRFESETRVGAEVPRRTRGRRGARAAVMLALVGGPLLLVAQGARYIMQRDSIGPVDELDIAFPARPQLPPNGTEWEWPLGSDNRGPAPSSELGGPVGQPRRWQVDSAPALEVGALLPLTGRAAGGGGAAGAVVIRSSGDSVGGPPEVLSVIGGAVRLADGRIVVGDFWAGIKFFDRSGRYLTSVDRATLRAEGGVSNVLPYRGDSLLVITGAGSSSRSTVGQARQTTDEDYIHATVVDLDGRVGRTIRASATRSGPPRPQSVRRSTNFPQGNLQGILSDGSFIFRGATLSPVTGTPGTRRGYATYYRVSPDGTTTDSIATMVVSETEETAARTPGGQPLSELAIFRLSAPRAAVHDRFLYWTDGSQFEVTVFDLTALMAEGSATAPLPVRTIRGSGAPVAVNDSIRNHRIERAVLADARRGSPSAAEVREMWRGRAMRPMMPAVNTVLTDESGNLWLEHYRVTMPLAGWPADTTDVPRWTVLDPSGRELGEVTTPRGLTVTQIGSDWVLGTYVSGSGSQHVRLHRIVR